MQLEILPADRWASAVAAALAERLADPTGPRLCLPTGTTPAPAYALVPDALVACGGSVEHATVVLLDEYVGLAPDDPARCDVQLRTQLLGRLQPPPRFVPVRVDELAPDAAAADLDAAAERLDLAVLGLGANGHVGMNEPGSDAGAPTRVTEIAAPTVRAAVERYGAVGRPTAGITIGLARLLAAGELWLLVTGARKAEILTRTLDGPMTPDVPASLLRAHPRLRVIADEAAAAGLAARPA